MRPFVICLAYTSTAMIIAGCSSTGSVARPFQGSAGVASSAKDYNEYDRDPPAQRSSSRIASEPSPVPPARGISLSRTIEVTPTGFRLRKGCTDSCAADGCSQQECTTQGCETQPSRLNCFGIRLHHIFDGRRLARFNSLFRCQGVVTDSCTEQGSLSCGGPVYSRPSEQAQDCLSETHPRMAPPLGELPESNDGGTSGHTLQNNQTDTQPTPGMVPDVPEVPVDRISQQRPIAPPKWHSEPLYSAVEFGGRTDVTNGHPELPQDPPVWSPHGKQGQSPSNFPGVLSPSASVLRSPGTNVPGEDFEISIEPLARVSTK